jgi:GNAT superfamily N-acetyltransferase
MNISIRQASGPADAETVSAILQEAATWLRERGIPMWRMDELAPDRIASEVAEGLFFLAECEGRPAGAIKFQLEDPVFWPDAPPGESAYVHRLAVKRQFAGTRASEALLGFAAARARKQGRKFLRLDCEQHRPKLRALYERFGFKHHSDREVDSYRVSRYEYPTASGPTA